MNYIGISNGFHDAGASVVNSSGDILFAAHSERYSKLKHDRGLSYDLMVDILNYSGNQNQIHYYERPLMTTLRQVVAGQSVRFETAKSRIGKNILQLLNNPKDQ